MPGQNAVSRSRDELKGLAILWIVFYHAKLGLGGALGGFQSLGYAGVDLFFFLTGFGLFHSLSQCGDLKRYCARRLWRILPAYLPVCAVWLCLMLPALELSFVPALQTILGNLLLVGYWGSVPQMISWYMSGLVPALVLAPFVHACLTRSARPRLAALVLLGLSGVCGLCFAFDERLIMVARLPVFILGMVFAMPPRQTGERFPRSQSAAVLLYALAFLLGAAALYLAQTRFPASLLDYGMYWYPFALMTPPLCAGLGWLLAKAKGGQRLLSPLRACGQASFEIFLLDCAMELYFKKVLGLGASPLWLWGSLGCAALGWAYHILVGKGLQRFSGKRVDL